MLSPLLETNLGGIELTAPREDPGLSGAEPWMPVGISVKLVQCNLDPDDDFDDDFDEDFDDDFEEELDEFDDEDLDDEDADDEGGDEDEPEFDEDFE
jgi:hypothetical protein